MVDLATGNIYGTDNSNELKINQHLLIIGMDNNKHKADQWDTTNAPLQDIECYVCHNNKISAVSNLAIPNISLFTDIQGNPYSANVLRDFLRCKRIDTLFPNKVVYSLKIGTGSVCDSDILSAFDTNYNSNHRAFIPQTEEMRWKINEMYVENYRMPDPYLTTIFKKLSL